MRVIRSAGQNVSPSDDGRLFDQIFSDGLFTETSITNLGGNNISIGAMYGDLCGRDFTTEAQTLAVVLPEGEGESTGYIYVEIDTSSEDVISVNSALAPFTPTYEDINTNGAVAQMIIAEYTATNLNVTSVTATYSTAGAGGVEPGSIATIERSPATANHSIGEFIVYNSKLYKVIAAIVTGETLVEGTNIESASVGSELTSLNNGLSAMNVLSTTEKIVGVDVDGSSIYEKTYMASAVNITSSTIIDNSITTSNARLISFQDAYFHNDLWYPSEISTSSAYAVLRSTGLQIVINNRTVTKYHITMRYIKL